MFLLFCLKCAGKARPFQEFAPQIACTRCCAVWWATSVKPYPQLRWLPLVVSFSNTSCAPPAPHAPVTRGGPAFDSNVQAKPAHFKNLLRKLLVRTAARCGGRPQSSLILNSADCRWWYLSAIHRVRRPPRWRWRKPGSAWPFPAAPGWSGRRSCTWWSGPWPGW